MDLFDLEGFGDYIIEKLFGFIVRLLNMALQPFVDLIKKFMSEPVNLVVFAEAWSIIVYILSMFYGLLLIYVGLKFIVSGEYPEQREKAKSSLKNIIIMMILVQASYHLYDLIISISSALTKVVLDLTSNSFFIITSSPKNIGFDIVLAFFYLIILITTLLILLLRYIFVSSGVIFFALGIFFYFVSPLNQYGKLIINFLMACVFLPFFYAIVFLAGSKLADGSSYKTLIMIGSFSLVILFTILICLFVIAKSALSVKKYTTPIVNMASSS